MFLDVDIESGQKIIAIYMVSEGKGQNVLQFVGFFGQNARNPLGICMVFWQNAQWGVLFHFACLDCSKINDRWTKWQTNNAKRECSGATIARNIFVLKRYENKTKWYNNCTKWCGVVWKCYEVVRKLHEVVHNWNDVVRKQCKLPQFDRIQTSLGTQILTEPVNFILFPRKYVIFQSRSDIMLILS